MLPGKIGLEEHFALEQTLGDSEKFVGPATWVELRRRLLKALKIDDCRGQRLVPLREMLQNLQS